MANFRYFSFRKDNLSEKEKNIVTGFDIMDSTHFFKDLKGYFSISSSQVSGKKAYAVVDKYGYIYLNPNIMLPAENWAYIMAHCLLHLAFGHFDKDKMPENADIKIWNKACDIYITRFLQDIKFGVAIFNDPAQLYKVKLNEEKKIYQHLIDIGDKGDQIFGTNSIEVPDMLGLDRPLIYKDGEYNEHEAIFAYALAKHVTEAVRDAGEHEFYTPTSARKAANWFMSHYPLLGGLASSFKLIEDVKLCNRYNIHIAAVDSSLGEIYINPAANLSLDEWKFVLAHEFLHAGLEHSKRCVGRDHHLWNIACDYVINDWLIEMNIGKMPDFGLLYDKELHGMSAEAIYDIIVQEMRKYKKLETFRGFGFGDIIYPNTGGLDGFRKSVSHNGISLDEFFKNALREGLDFHTINSRGYLPAGLVEEIKALTTPAIPWDVELGKWFDINFPILEKHRTYARPSRRQGSTPDIPRPSYHNSQEDFENRTFGVVVDTSGSMSNRQIGLALGAIASYAQSKDVPAARVVFCDADAYDAGYITPDQLLDKVKVTGRGGTALQPAIDLLEQDKNFPPNGPILIITDGGIEDKLYVHREHAYLLPKGNKLPFESKGKLFYFE